jgi:thioredoxin reductase
MNRVQLIIVTALAGLFLLVNQLAHGHDTCARCPGGLPWYGWLSGFVVLFIAGSVFARQRGESAHQLLAQPAPKAANGPAIKEKLTPELRRKYDLDGPAYPHPVIVTERCIGCSRCVESCPHDVLTIAYTEAHQPVAAVVDAELCLEDTSCEFACPVNPKACVVVNTAKAVKVAPLPFRHATCETNVAGCYVVGDVSGTPLIKNAANEGAAVMLHVAHELRAQNGAAAPQTDYDVAVVGAGPAGLSAIVMAQKLGLRYVGFEKDTVMATLVRFYPQGKYVYLKPETTAWAGGIHLPGLEEYVEEVLEEFVAEADRERVLALLAAERAGKLSEADQKFLDAVRQSYQTTLEADLVQQALAQADEKQRAAAERELIDAATKRRKKEKTTLEEWLAKVAPGESLTRLAKARSKFAALLEAEDKYELDALHAAAAAGTSKLTPAEQTRLNWARQHHGDQFAAWLAGKLTEERYQALAAARRRVAGDQREVLLHTWLANVREQRAVVHENEQCTAVQRAADGDYFVVKTKRDGEEQERSCTARRVVLALGNSSAPRRLGLDNEDGKVKRRAADGTEIERERVLYRLSDPSEFKGLKLVIIGGGNSAVEAAVDLAAWRQGDEIVPRADDERNDITMLVRPPGIKTDVKFGNKQQLYKCVDNGLIKLKLDSQIKKILPGAVVFTNMLTGKDETVENDHIFAFIGSVPPQPFLEKTGIQITKS